MYTAKDITPQVRYIKGVGPKKQQDLLEWRDTLEQFFQFNPSQIPASEFAAVQREMDGKRMVKLQKLEAGIAQLKKDIQIWQTLENPVTNNLIVLKGQLAQREKTIELIQSWKDN